MFAKYEFEIERTVLDFFKNWRGYTNKESISSQIDKPGYNERTMFRG